MIKFLPKSLCSSDYSVVGLPSGNAVVEYDKLSEQGGISSNGVEFLVRKHGPLSGRWTLEQAGNIVAEAHKASAMFRHIEMSGQDMHPVSVRAESTFTRVFDIIIRQEVVGHVRPVHAFTRRAIMECQPVIPPHIQLFVFWLVALLWNRDVNVSAATAGAVAGSVAASSGQ